MRACSELTKSLRDWMLVQSATTLSSETGRKPHWEEILSRSGSTLPKDNMDPHIGRNSIIVKRPPLRFHAIV